MSSTNVNAHNLDVNENNVISIFPYIETKLIMLQMRK